MERSPMLMDWQNQHKKWLCWQKQSTCSIQFSSKFQWHSSQRLKTYPKVHLETQKNTKNQGNTEQKVQSWRYHNTQLKTILQNHSNKNSMWLAQKQTWIPVEQNRGLGYESNNYAFGYPFLKFYFYI
jgi:hypothetical protein